MVVATSNILNEFSTKINFGWSLAQEDTFIFQTKLTVFIGAPGKNFSISCQKTGKLVTTHNLDYG